jgi:hypothetical protein
MGITATNINASELLEKEKELRRRWICKKRKTIPPKQLTRSKNFEW